ncbi:hypothetical protein D3C78_1703380 [compost metagenome]
MQFTKEQMEKIELEFSRSREFRGYSLEEVFRLGMMEVLKIVGVDIPENMVVD